MAAACCRPCFLKHEPITYRFVGQQCGALIKLSIFSKITLRLGLKVSHNTVWKKKPNKKHLKRTSTKAKSDCSVQFNLYNAFYNKIVSRCFTEFYIYLLYLKYVSQLAASLRSVETNTCTETSSKKL